ncbi:MAG: ubiquinone/menaquinone biosynthesis methyltransferase [Gemmatimonadota bacterium]|nr:ubiquinone/menaquinone biosynthesis methyltransferase [Gemmatimonadota bacterium]
MKRTDQVRTIFSEIAPTYDLLNHVLSFNVDGRWRKQAVRMLRWRDHKSGRYLDACAGTFDLSLALVSERDFAGSVVATDFALPMLLEGRDKLRGSISTVCGDTLRLPFSDGCFDGATVGFGVRNLTDLSGGFSALARVIRPGARLVILEFTLPPNPVFRALYKLYFNRILPIVGRVVSGHPWAYTYLPESVKEFPPPSELADLLRESGFKDVKWRFVTGGIAAIYVGIRV